MKAGKEITAPVAQKFVTDDLLKRLRHYAPEGAPDECWEWTAARNKGYGAISVPGSKMRVAHVVAWELHHGRSLPEGMVVRHTCDNPPCVNPAHLVLGNHVDNINDKIERGRWGEPRQGFKHRTPEQVQAMRELAAAGTNLTEIARRFNCSRATAIRIVRGESMPTGHRKSSVAKFTEDDIREIRRRHVNGETQTSIAKLYGVSQGNISSIVRRNTWSHVE